MTGEARDPFKEAREFIEQQAESAWEPAPSSEEVQATLLETAGEVVGLLRSIDASVRLLALATVAQNDTGWVSQQTVAAAALEVERALREAEDGAS